MTKTNHFNLMFDPKKSRGVVSTHYPEALSDAVVTAAQLQANLSSEKRDSDVIFWGKLEDIVDNSRNITPDRSFRTKELSTISNLPVTRSDLPELTAIEIDKITKNEVKDCNGQVIENFNQYEIPIAYQNNGNEENTKLLVSENKDIYALSEHALKNNKITEEQKAKIDYLIERINPDSNHYIPEVGIVNDVKKPIILFLEQKVFQGGSYYLDIDRAERLKEFDEKQYVKKSVPNEPKVGMQTANGKEIDVIFLQNSRTDENQLFSVIEGYYDNFRGTRLPEGFEKKRLGITDLLFRVNYLDNESLNIKPLDGKQLFTLKLKHQKGRTWQNGNIESNSIVR